jgi:hypothetical protein
MKFKWVTDKIKNGNNAMFYITKQNVNVKTE